MVQIWFNTRALTLSFEHVWQPRLVPHTYEGGRASKRIHTTPTAHFGTTRVLWCAPQRGFRDRDPDNTGLGLDCVPLPHGCIEGDPHSPCISCLEPSLATTNADRTECVCRPGFGDIDPSNTFDGLRCTAPLGEGCATKNITHVCLSCADANSAVNDRRDACTCNTGFRDASSGTGWDGLVCEPLGQGCAAGTATDSCASCTHPNASVWKSGAARGECRCDAGFYDADPSTAYVAINRRDVKASSRKL